MAGKIRILPESVAQTIAAGEVVERPASVVKELMENAIDAGSHDITVELKAGGLQLIRVLDNGGGMEAEDLPLALQRYATSKISHGDDLFRVATLGFRGEALPSVAAVSRMTIRTRVPHALSGSQIQCEGGEIKSHVSAGSPVGTEVEVRDLFYNVPVKRKFVKSIRSELRQILTQFLRLCLAYPSTGFRLLHDGRLLHDFPKTDSFSIRIEAVFGREVYEALDRFEYEQGEIRIAGYASLPSLSRTNLDGISLYVNSRFVKDRMVTKAITEAYRYVLPAGRFPVAILWVNLPPSTVDVNVHPTKAEVKFRDPDRVFRAVHGALQSLRGPAAFVPASGPSMAQSASFPSLSHPSRPLMDVSATWRTGIPSRVSEAEPEWKTERDGRVHIVGQIYGTYLLCEVEDGVLFIDQHAAHERLLFDRYQKEFEAQSVPAVALLIPVLMELSGEEFFVLESHLEEFRALGFEFDPAGDRMMAVRSIPAAFDQAKTQEAVREILHEISSWRKEGKGGNPLQAVLVTLACHDAIRAHAPLDGREMEALVEDLKALGRSATCPHGRPIFFFLSRDELNRQFKRK